MFGKKQMALAKSSRGWQALGRLGAGFCLWAMIVLASLAQENPPPPPPPTDDLPREALPQNDVEVLTRGPVHEAFAEPLANDPEAGLIVPRKPPEDIAEVPPDFKPAGDDVVWISGYWAWDDDRDHFLWVSGICEASAGAALDSWLLGGRGCRRRLAVGFWSVGSRPTRRVGVPCHAARIFGGRAEHAASQRQLLLGSGMLDVVRRRLSLATRLLASVSGELGLGTRSLDLDPQRLLVRRRILGLSNRNTRSTVRARLFPKQQLVRHALLLAVVRDREHAAVGSLLGSAAIFALLFRRLLRSQLRHFRAESLVTLAFTCRSLGSVADTLQRALSTSRSLRLRGADVVLAFALRQPYR